MHKYYGVNEKVVEFDKEKLQQFLNFRMAFLDEELNETKKAVREKNAEEIVDGLIDLCVVAIGTLDSMGVDAHEAWTQVLRANLAKEVGIKPERPNPLGLPDLIKPAGWKAPSHAKNHGLLTKLK
jgi:predicted HAD superfamily Cof-like phosphohydrolase